MADFKQLRGNRLLLNLPKKEEGKLIVDENTKEALEKEMMQKLNKLSVYAVGDLVQDIKVGDDGKVINRSTGSVEESGKITKIDGRQVHLGVGTNIIGMEISNVYLRDQVIKY